MCDACLERVCGAAAALFSGGDTLVRNKTDDILKISLHAVGRPRQVFLGAGGTARLSLVESPSHLTATTRYRTVVQDMEVRRRRAYFLE